MYVRVWWCSSVHNHVPVNVMSARALLCLLYMLTIYDVLLYDVFIYIFKRARAHYIYYIMKYNVYDECW